MWRNLIYCGDMWRIFSMWRHFELIRLFGLLIKLFYVKMFVEICTRWEIITFIRHSWILIKKVLNVVLNKSLIFYLTYILTFEVAIQIRRNPSSYQKNAFESILLLMLAVVTSPSQTVYENLSHLHNLRSAELLIWIDVNIEQVQANIKSNFDGILEN